MVWGRNGVASTADIHGSLAGLRMLLRGGNAIAAVVAAAAALNVAEPYMSGLGGFGGFMLIYLAAPRKVVGLDMVGTSPAASSMETMTEEDCDAGYYAPIVPGALMGWAEALTRYGTMSLGDVSEPAIELALADDDRYNTGKDVKIPVRRLISKEYAAQQRDKIDPRRAAAFPGPPFPMEGTTSLATADRWGNAVVFTQSLSGGFGSGVVAGDTGIFLNNGHSFGFVLDPDHVNSLEGGARAKGVMTPALVLRDDRLLMGVGAAGGYTIPQTVGQVITKALVYRMDIQRAIASPRMVINRGGGRAPAPGDSHTYLEAGFPENVYAELGALGHTLVPPGNAGGVQGVYTDLETEALAGGADPRRDGHALAW